MVSFYTGKGDAGVSQIGELKHPKDSPILEALGDLDELNSLLGVVRSGYGGQELGEKLRAVQEALFLIQANLGAFLAPGSSVPELREEKRKELEREIGEIEEKLQLGRGFIVPGANPLSAWLDYVRTVARRAERSCYRAHKEHPIPVPLSYMNRLSSYLFALARLEASKEHIKESHPQYE